MASFKAQIRITTNTISRDLRRALSRAKNAEPALRAAGEVVVQRTRRSWREAGLRISPWAPLKPATLAAKAKKGQSSSLLVASSTLVRMPRILSVDKGRVRMGSATPYGRYHQMGEGVMYRPFWPFSKQGQMEAKCRDIVERVLKRKLAVTG